MINIIQAIEIMYEIKIKKLFPEFFGLSFLIGLAKVPKMSKISEIITFKVSIE